MSQCFKKRNRLSEEIRAGIIYLSTGLFLVLCLTSGFYLLSVTQGSQMGYSFKQKELEQNTLLKENQTLKLRVLEVSSYNSISKSDTILSMEEATPDFFESREERLSKN
jgi:hypothetical protein